MSNLIFKPQYRRWYVAVTTFLSVGTSIGLIQYAFQAFVIPLEEEFGWSRTQINLSLSLGIASSFIAPFAGRFLDKFGSMKIMASSLLIISIGFFMRGSMNELWQLYLSSILLYVGIPGATQLPLGKLMGLWFPKIRGRMIGFTMAGNNFSAVVSVPIATFLILSSGWRSAFYVLGVSTIIVLILVLLFIRDDKNIDFSEKSSDKSKIVGDKSDFELSEAMRTNAFWFLAIGLTLQQFARTTVVIQLVPHFISQGISTPVASSMMSAFGIFAVIGHLFPVYIGFRGGKGIATMLGLLIGLHPLAAFYTLFVFIMIFIFFRYVSLASIIASFTFPLIIIIFLSVDIYSLKLFSVFVPILSLITHQKNIERLVRGEETKVNFDKK